MEAICESNDNTYVYPPDSVNKVDLNGEAWGLISRGVCKLLCKRAWGATKWAGSRVKAGSKRAWKSVKKANKKAEKKAYGFSARLGGRNSFLFGKGAHEYRKGILNRGPVRIGWGWKGSKKNGHHVFRIAWGNKGTWSHGHRDLFRLPRGRRWSLAGTTSLRGTPPKLC